MTQKTTDCRYACAAFPHCGCTVEALSPPALDREKLWKRIEADTAAGADETVTVGPPVQPTTLVDRVSRWWRHLKMDWSGRYFIDSDGIWRQRQ